MSKKIEDYALLSDCFSAALVDRSGSIDWLSFPRFDSPACFASLLGTEENGYWKISPEGNYKIRRKYIEGSLVLETTFFCEEWECRLTDCMVYGDKYPTLIRRVESIRGSVDIALDLTIRFDYGRVLPWVQYDEGRTMKAIAGPETLILRGETELQGTDHSTKSRFKLKEGERKTFTLIWHQSQKESPKIEADPCELQNRTLSFWKKWREKNSYEGFDEENVRTSLTVLKALTYKPTGAIIAAPTTSLPEYIGGNRNWDYRFGWLRDSSLTLQALLLAGYRDEAIEWQHWLTRAVAGTPDQASIMYGILGERRLTEFELDWLPGYEGSKPVRIGNAAHEQFQLDVFGEVLSASLVARKNGIDINERAWEIERNFADYVVDHWKEPDEGVWEVRSGRRHFTHSKAMAWCALNCAIESAKRSGLECPIERWKEIRDKIHQDVCRNGYDEKLKTFTQAYGSKELDASLLMLTKIGFLPPDDPRIKNTVLAIQKDLSVDGFVRRYRTESGVDGLSGEEGCFLPCSFWLVDNLNLIGKKDEALELYRHLMSTSNDLGLFSEEYSPKLKRLVGNFPQGFTHVAHVISAMSLGENKSTASVA